MRGPSKLPRLFMNPEEEEAEIPSPENLSNFLSPGNPNLKLGQILSLSSSR